MVRQAFEHFILEHSQVFAVELDGLFEKQYREASATVKYALQNATKSGQRPSKPIALFQLNKPDSSRLIANSNNG